MKQRMGERDGTNSNRTAITSLQVIVQMWPTARSEDAESAGNHPGATDSLTGATKLWVTPRTANIKGSQKRLLQGSNESIESQAQMWQTPATDSFRSRGGDRKDEMGLDQQARMMFPTPAQRDYRSPNAKPYSERGGETKGEQLANFVCHSSLPDQPTESDGQRSSVLPPGSRPRLNPAFVALLMS
jgi:hypothetical protein